MADTIESILIGAAAGLGSAILTHFSTRAKIRLDLAAEYDKVLQESRLHHYKELWALLEPTAKYGRAPVTHDVIRTLTNKSRDWYFEKGGIYLTVETRKPYFEWKRLLEELYADEALAQHPQTAIPEERLAPMLKAASELRTALSDDIGTKRLSRI
jgi:hypothetical protein